VGKRVSCVVLWKKVRCAPRARPTTRVPVAGQRRSHGWVTVDCDRLTRWRGPGKTEPLTTTSSTSSSAPHNDLLLPRAGQYRCQ